MTHSEVEVGVTRSSFQPFHQQPVDALRSALEEARRTQTLAVVANIAVQSALEAVIRALVRPGAVLKKGERSNPRWLSDFGVLRGHAPDATTFVVLSELTVEVNIAYPELSKWICEARPVIRKNGNLVSGLFTGHGSRESSVELIGSVTDNFCDDVNQGSALLEIARAAQMSLEKPTIQFRWPAIAFQPKRRAVTAVTAGAGKHSSGRVF